MQKVNRKSADLTKKFSDRLVGCRTFRSLSQSELANQCGASLRSVQVWEAGETNIPRPAMLRSLAAVLRTSVEYLLGESDEMTVPKRREDQQEGHRPVAELPPEWVRIEFRKVRAVAEELIATIEAAERRIAAINDDPELGSKIRALGSSALSAAADYAKKMGGAGDPHQGSPPASSGTGTGATCSPRPDAGRRDLLGPGNGPETKS